MKLAEEASFGHNEWQFNGKHVKSCQPACHRGRALHAHSVRNFEGEAEHDFASNCGLALSRATFDNTYKPGWYNSD